MAMRSIAHIEIPAGDPAAAGKFYSTLFGWETESMPGMDYEGFRTGTVVGGFPRVGPMATAGEVVLYIESAGIDEDLRRIEAEGGHAIVPRSEIPGMGHFAIFTDPTGNKVGLFEARAG